MYDDTPEATKTTIAQAVTACLYDLQDAAAGWQCKPIEDYPTRRIVHRDGYGLWLRWEDRHKRIEVSALWPQDGEGRVQVPRGADCKITVAADTPAAKIAKAIVTRFLPTYLEHWRTAKERADNNDRDEAKTAAGVARLVAAGGRQGHHSKNTVYFQHSHLYTVTVQGDSARLDAFNVPIDQLVALVPLLADGTKPEAVGDPDGD